MAAKAVKMYSPASTKLPEELCERSISYIHADGDSELTLREVAHMHGQLALTSRKWCQLSRRIHFQEVSAENMHVFCGLLRVLREKGCTIATPLTSLTTGERASSDWDAEEDGCILDYIDIRVLFALAPSLQELKIFPIKHSTLREHRFLHKFNQESAYHSAVSPSTLTHLSIRPDLFIDLTAFFALIMRMTSLSALKLYGLSPELLLHVPGSFRINSLTLIEDTMYSNRGAPWVLSDHGYKPATTLPKPSVFAPKLKQLQYQNLCANQHLWEPALSLFGRVAEETIHVTICYGPSDNASINAQKEPCELITMFRGRATATILDEEGCIQAQTK